MGGNIKIARSVNPRVRKVTCPKCGGLRCFSLFLNIETHELYSEEYGVCDHKNRCAYVNTPGSLAKPVGTAPQVERKIFTPSKEDLEKALLNRSDDSLFKYLCSIFPVEDVRNTFELYKVSSEWVHEYHPSFWYIDQNSQPRGCKTMGYKGGKRIKTPYPMILWSHRKLNRKGGETHYTVDLCLYGEHLINSSDIIHVVESEKTALICNIVYPELVFVATGGISNIKYEKLKVLTGKHIVYIPDKGAYSEWWYKACNLNIPDWEMSKLVETSTLKEGEDIADFILNEYR